jgi:hypothetical protein
VKLVDAAVANDLAAADLEEKDNREAELPVARWQAHETARRFRTSTRRATRSPSMIGDSAISVASKRRQERPDHLQGAFGTNLPCDGLCSTALSHKPRVTLQITPGRRVLPAVDDGDHLGTLDHLGRSSDRSYAAL